jgi:hypothetical protein
MKTTETWFDEFYNEVRYQIEQGAKANFTRSNQIWAEYSALHSVGRTCEGHIGGSDVKEWICQTCGLPIL